MVSRKRDLGFAAVICNGDEARCGRRGCDPTEISLAPTAARRAGAKTVGGDGIAVRWIRRRRRRGGRNWVDPDNHSGKWSKIEHRLFCHITQNRRGKPLTSFEAVVNLIGSTRTRKGLRVKAQLDKNHYPTGVEITESDMKRLALQRDEFHGDWNHGFDPRRS
jgi:hypothetical protein